MFQVTVHRALHEGGTKFYQQVKIDHTDSGLCFLIQHWGRWPHTSFNLSGGQRKILKTTRSQGDWEYREKLEAKTRKKKPGDQYKETDRKNKNLASLSALRDFVMDELGATRSQANDITGYFDSSVLFKAEPAAPLAPITAKGSRDVPVTEGWGSW